MDHSNHLLGSLKPKHRSTQGHMGSALEATVPVGKAEPVLPERSGDDTGGQGNDRQPKQEEDDNKWQLTIH